MTLTQASALTRQTIIILAILIFLGLSLWVGFSIYKALLPPPQSLPPGPTLKFGSLPQPLFPTTSFSATNYQFALDTETGSLPTDFPTLVNVYFVPIQEVTLLASEKAQTIALKFGFNIGPQIITPTLYRYRNQNGGVFTIDIASGNFNLETLLSTSSATTIAPSKTDSELGNEFKNYLSSRITLPESLANGRTTVLPANQVIPSSLVSLFPTDIDNLKIVTPSFYSGITQAITNPSQLNRENPYTKLDYIYWQIDPNTSSTYPLKSVSQAFQQLQQGTGVIITAPDKARVSITKVYLAYYQSTDYPTYLQPVFVFEGPEFVGYVPSVDNSIFQTTNSTSSATPR